METNYVLVLWIGEGKYSVLTEDFVTDQQMLNDPELVGLVQYGVIGKNPPTSGWRSYPAKVVATAGK